MVRLINIPQVDNYRTSHQVVQALRVKGTELLPFCGDHQRVSTLGTFTSVLSVDHISECGLRLVHADWIEGAHSRAHIL